MFIPLSLHSKWCGEQFASCLVLLRTEAGLMVFFRIFWCYCYYMIRFKLPVWLTFCSVMKLNSSDVISGSTAGQSSGITALYTTQPRCRSRHLIAFVLPTFQRAFSKDVGGSFSSGGDSSKTPFSGSGRGTRSGSGDKGGGDKRDGWLCPNCGEMCSHVDMFICKHCLNVQTSNHCLFDSSYKSHGLMVLNIYCLHW